MKVVIDIDESDYKELCQTVMSIDEMENTTQGRVYGAIVRGGMIKLPSVDTCGDCISRKAATDRFDLVQSDDKCMGYDDILAFLSSLPSVEPERKPGKWKITSTLEPTRGFFAECSNCKEIVFGGGKYCKECGSKMEVDG